MMNPVPAMLLSYTSMPSDFQVMTGSLINPTFGSFLLLPFLVMYVNFVGKITGASSACFFIFQNDSELPDLFNFISVIQSLGSFIIPPLLSLHPRG